MKKILLSVFLLTFGLLSFSQEKNPADKKGAQRLYELQADPSAKIHVTQDLESAQTFGTATDSAVSRSNGDGPQIDKCGTLEAMEILRQQNPFVTSDEEFETWMSKKLEERKSMSATERSNHFGGEIITVPIVVHVIHDGNPVNTVGNVVGNNISAAQVESQITVLNQDFRKLNPDRANTPLWDDRAADFEIEFAPILYHPETGIPLAEPGIHRVDRNDMGWPALPYDTEFIQSDVKPATSWDWESVVNIWVMELPGGLYGYAQFPSQSGLPGMPGSGGASDTDGVVMAPFTFGTSALDDGSFTTASTEFGRTTTHELGHWVGLRHVWGDGDCSDDDFVEDTPPQSGNSPFGSCNPGQNTCDDVDYGYSTDLPDMKENYMDYSSDSCMNLFTEGQKARAEIVFAESPGRGNLADSPYDEYDAPMVYFSEGSVSQTKLEGEGCELYTDYQFGISVAYSYTGTDNIVATLNVTGGTATAGADYEIIGDDFVTFSGGERDEQFITVRIYNDGVTEGSETINFELDLDAGNTNVVLTDNEDYKATTWTVNDAEVSADALVTLLDHAEGVGSSSCVGGELLLTIELDNYPEETSWQVTNDAGDVVESSNGTYSGQADGSIVTEDISLGNGNYTFTMLDSYGDGFGGSAYYELTSGTTVVASGSGNFGRSQSTDFCVSAGSSFNGVLATNASVQEIASCGDEAAEYVIAVNISSCVSGEQDVKGKIVVLDNGQSNQATLGEDFSFPEGQEFEFNGEGEQTVFVTIAFLGDSMVEGPESLQLGIEYTENGNLVTNGDPVVANITILDSDAPIFTLMPSVSSIMEGDYNCETGDNKMFDVAVQVDGCPTDGLSIDLTLTTADGSVAVLGEDFNIVGDATYTLTSANVADDIIFTIEVLNDGIIEGAEDLMLTLTLSDDNAASVASGATVVIRDPQGVTPPFLTYVMNETFDGGMPAGWSIVATNENSPNTFVVTSNTGLDGMAAHITSDAETGTFDYENTTSGSQIILLTSDLFDVNGKVLFDMLYQVEGEPGFFGNYDFGFVGFVDESVDATNASALVDAVRGYSLIGTPDPTLLTSSIGSDFNIAEFAEANGFSGQMRLVFAWVSDYSGVYNPPLAVDNIEAKGGNYIETDKMIGPERPSFPIDAGNDTYYYNLLSSEIAMMVNSSSDHGCGSGYVYQAGTGAQQFISEYADEFVSAKSFAVQVPNADKEASLLMGLYYTEEEIAGWEFATGKTRDELYMYKTYDYALGAVYSENVTFSLTFDRFPTETSWSIVNDGTGDVVAAGASYDATYSGQTITMNLDLPMGDYTFTIEDSFGDGICCNYGEGSFVLSAGGDVIIEGSDFGSSATASFTTGEAVELCLDYRDVEFAPVTLVEYEGGYKVEASFPTGLAELTGFGVGSLPAFTPGEFTAVQVDEQVNITFENKFAEGDDLAYYIFEELTENLEWVELETVTADGSGSYTVVDYFPYNGINRYRVTAVYSNGDKLAPCYEAEVFFKQTNDFQVSPNPAVNDINVIISDGNVQGLVDVAIYDETGRTVLTDQFNAIAGVSRYNVDISKIATGEYYIKVMSQSGYMRTATFIKAAN